jgi:hypothetical protein
VTVEVLPVRAWYCLGHEPALATFVLKESAAVKKVIRRARSVLRCLVRGKTNFEDVLDDPHRDPVATIAKILYFCLQEGYEIAYGREPRYYGTDWQAVRFPADILDANALEGTCIDLALLFAACLENRSLSPVIIILQTGILPGGYTLQHALVGCWTDPLPRSTVVEKNGKAVLGWVNLGALLLLDPVGFAHGKHADQLFTRSQALARKSLERACARVQGHAFCYAVDIEVARNAGLEPLPFGSKIEFDRTAWLALSRARQEAAQRGSPTVGGRHLLLGLLSLSNGLLGQALARRDSGLAAKVAEQAGAALGSSGPLRPRSPWRTSPHWDAVLRSARKRARREKRLLVGEADLVIALLEVPNKVGEVLEQAGVTAEQCLEDVRAVLTAKQEPSVWTSSRFAD